MTRLQQVCGPALPGVPAGRAPADSVGEASVTQWIRHLAAGDPSAAEKIWRRYYERLVRFARAKLAGADRRVSDEEDVVQSVFGSFFPAVASGRFPELNDRAGLWRLLLVMASRKAASLARRELAQKRGGGEVRGESALLEVQSNGENIGLDRILGNEPTPEFAALAEEQCQGLLDVLDDDLSRRTAMLRLEGYTVDEIACQLARAPGTIHRKLARIRRKWEEQAAGVC
jgi:RNA polymerase sigma factor (sigma-70 family)